MFLLENDEVRQKGFNAVRDEVQATLEKHGVTVKVLRLWGEQQLAYKIGQRSRATYLLAWLEASGEAVNSAKKDFYLVGSVFRCFFLREDAIPEDELSQGILDVADGELVIPEEVEEIVEEEPWEEPEEAQEIQEESKEQAEEPTEEKAEEKAEEPVAATEEDK
jgi:ribosomal protein S6